MCQMHGEREVAGSSLSHGREILPGNVVPKHYDLTLEPDFTKLTYEGKVIIDLEVVEDTTSISLNTLELEIHRTRVVSGGATIS